MQKVARTLIAVLAAPMAGCGGGSEEEPSPPLRFTLSAPAQVQGVRTGNSLACSVNFAATLSGGSPSDFARWESSIIEWKYATASSVFSLGPSTLSAATMAQVFGGAQLESGATQVGQFSTNTGSVTPPILTATLNYAFNYTLSTGLLGLSSGVVQCQ